MAKEKRSVAKQRALERYLDQLIDDNVFRTRREIAQECGIDDAQLSMVLTVPGRRLSIEQCLRLARKIQAPPSEILRVADRDSAAAVLDDLWPKQRDHVSLTRSERELIDLWRDTPVSDRHHIQGITRSCAERARARTGGPATRANGAKPWRPRRKRR